MFDKITKWFIPKSYSELENSIDEYEKKIRWAEAKLMLDELKKKDNIDSSSYKDYYYYYDSDNIIKLSKPQMNPEDLYALFSTGHLAQVYVKFERFDHSPISTTLRAHFSVKNIQNCSFYLECYNSGMPMIENTTSVLTTALCMIKNTIGTTNNVKMCFELKDVNIAIRSTLNQGDIKVEITKIGSCVLLGLGT